MIYDPENAPHLKTWLVRTLEPICDAEPGALADYILALLKHNVPESEMRKELTAQLDEFLEKECSPFIDTLFTALRTKSYLPYISGSDDIPSKSLDTGIPIPLDGLLSPSIPTSPGNGRKRSLDSDDRDDRPPAKGQRLNSDGQFSRYGNGSGSDFRSTGGWNNRGRMQGNFYGAPHGMNGVGHPPNRPISYHPPDQRRICRDYHNLGYCSRGALCKYSHGEDALIPEQLYMNGPRIPGPGMPFMPMFPSGFAMGAGAAYDPRESHMDMRANGRSQMRPSVLPRMQQEDGARVAHSMHASGELPVIQDLTPQVAHSDVQPNPNPQPHPPSNTTLETERIVGPPSLPPQDVEMVSADAPPRPSSGWRGRGRGRGGFGGEAGTFRPERRKDKTLVLEKIPDDKLSLAQVNDWFKRFGTVTNVAIDQAHHKALISFSTHEEAHAAWKSEDAVFGNRFVKIFWHRPLEGQGQVGQRALAASAPLVSNANAPKPTPAPAPPTSTPTRPATALAAKQQLLEQQITEQKSLMASLGTASPEEKKSIMARIRKLDEEMKASSTTSSAVSSGPDREQQERERLDKELDLHGTTGSTADGQDGEKAETTEELKAKLEKLKAEAASLGIADVSMEGSESYGGSYRPYRGRARGRGRGYFRGAPRGGPPRASMKLDNRPKSLLIKGASSENEQALRDWYETTGGLASIGSTDDGLVVTFKTRHAAEQGFAKGSSIPIVGEVQVSWHNHAPPPSSLGAKPTGGSATEFEPEPEPSTLHEEEVVASGWGDEEDGMGM
ncbi:hypothetical protein K435DRAFT_966722 [Dendrothele bispora CBS 962.96]|uniref:C3H1-type domain-containing protein n=1 Tax=Dendrothele bispora (strain CBS 962.96) TaxID=1314807 RepID=A0A4S8LQW2_DENBC|nr:hypothetical protein K435DRAFT_758957 [Dendrothele bispora CBS 962.96]THU94869.1 hypothetical protein K435DRAFT_966722 [Dendrothele bispora CBS 962.96]